MLCWIMRGASTTVTLIVLATDEHALGERQLGAIHAIARTHPMVIVDGNHQPVRCPRTVADADTGRRLPAFSSTP